MSNYVFAAESVTEGHPDKLADRISDSILDAILKNDPNAKVACETLISNGFCVIAGEISTDTYAPITEIAREAIREAGYTNAEFGFDYRSAGILTAIGEQSHDIRNALIKDGELCAGDQGVVFGYACKETKEYMPLPITLAHKIAKALTKARKDGLLPYLYPDGKTQVGIKYENGIPVSVEDVVVSAQHSASVPYDILKEALIEEIIKPCIGRDLISKTINYRINPTGIFVTGGPQADTGLTGRKNIVDTYGGACPHGGGALSGKDPSKIDRCGSYVARFIAKNIVAAEICEKMQIQLSYVIGEKFPMNICVNTFNTSKISDEELIKAIVDIFPLTPSSIIKDLNLLRPIYSQTSAYGHFGRDELNFPWESLEKIENLKSYFKI